MMKAIGLSITLLIALLATGAHASGTQTVTLATGDISVLTPPDTTLGPQYVLQFSVPSEVTSGNLIGAFLQCSVDASATAISNWTNDTPVIEVYALTSAVTSAVDRSQLVASSGAARNVIIGDDRTVQIDISEAVLYFLANPGKNYGLVVGSFRGGKEGLFALGNQAATSGSAVQVTFFFR